MLMPDETANIWPTDEPDSHERSWTKPRQGGFLTLHSSRKQKAQLKKRPCFRNSPKFLTPQDHSVRLRNRRFSTHQPHLSHAKKTENQA